MTTEHENHGGAHWSPRCPACCPDGVLRMPIMRQGLFVPFLFLDEATAKRNHGQTLWRLAERGGLGASEALAIIERRPYKPMHPAEALVELRNWLVLRSRSASV